MRPRCNTHQVKAAISFGTVVCAFGVTDAAVAQLHGSDITFRSTLHGVELVLGDGWRYQPVYYCDYGSELIERQRPINVKCENDAGLKLFINSWREYAGSPTHFEEWIATCADKHCKTELTLNGMGITRHTYQHNGYDHAAYIVAEPPRRLRLDFSTPATLERGWLDESEQIVRTLRLTEPWVDEPRADWKTVQGNGFRISYPGDWRWKRPDVDSCGQGPDRITIAGPHDCSLGLPVTVSLSKEFQGLTEYERRQRSELNEFQREFPDYQLDVSSRPLDDEQGKPGRRIQTRLAANDGAAWVHITYAYEVESDESVIFACGAISESSWLEIEPIIDKMAACLEITENEP